MDFSNRTAQPQPTAPAVHPATAPVSGGKKVNKSTDTGKMYRILTVVGVVVVSILLIFAVIALFANTGNSDEDKYVQPSKLQAVFLNTGQVYFGNIKVLNSSYYVLTNIYYLQTSSSSTSTTSSANTSVSLVKLGCELHEPYDQMVLNTGQVTFWENLQSDGQVAKAVAAFQKANPDGQKCSDQSASSSTTSGTSVQNAGTTSTGSTSTTNP
jgi:uncharacterized membrane protein